MSCNGSRSLPATVKSTWARRCGKAERSKGLHRWIFKVNPERLYLSCLSCRAITPRKEEAQLGKLKQTASSLNQSLNHKMGHRRSLHPNLQILCTPKSSLVEFSVKLWVKPLHMIRSEKLNLLLMAVEQRVSLLHVPDPRFSSSASMFKSLSCDT